MLVIDPEMKAFLEAGVAIRVGTRDQEMRPCGVSGWGARVSGEGRVVELFIDRPPSTQTLANLRANGEIATVFANVQTERTIQLKGRCVEICDPEPDDWPWLDAHRQAFTEQMATIGFPAQVIRNLWSNQVVKLRFVVAQAFDQTPGVGAGRQL
jgi:hypothetical protein